MRFFAFFEIRLRSRNIRRIVPNSALKYGKIQKLVKLANVDRIGCDLHKMRGCRLSKVLITLFFEIRLRYRDIGDSGRISALSTEKVKKQCKTCYT